MRRCLLVVLALTACGPTRTVPGAVDPAPPAATAPPATAPIPTAHGAGRVEERVFHSAALGVDKRYLVHLPGGYGDDPAARWPVVYYLHGLGGSERDYVDGLDLAARADRLAVPAIIVTPDGDASFYVDGVTPPDYDACMRDGDGMFDPRADRAATCTRTARYEAYMVDDLIADVDARYATRTDRGGRAIAGLSMGGYGALVLALRHPDRYSAVASHAGVDALLYLGPHPYVADQVTLVESPALFVGMLGRIGDVFRRVFGDDVAYWRARDPALLVDGLAPGTLALYLDAAADDDLLLNDGARYLHDRLVARGIPHAFTVAPGHHDFAFVGSRLDESLRFFADHFRGR